MPSMDIDKSIEIYFGHFQDLIACAKQLNAKEKSYLYRKSILISILDALAKIPYGHLASNRSRFTEFITNFCSWGDNDRISLPHLFRFFRLVNDPIFSELRKFAQEELEKWPENAIIPLSHDPKLSEIAPRWPSGWKKRIDENHRLARITHESFRHADFLWNLRNSVAHELRELGYGFEIKYGADEPHYYMYDKDIETSEKSAKPILDIEAGKLTWELVYPIKFIEKLVDSGHKNLKDYCASNRVNPFSAYTFGTYWIETLNE